MAITTATHGKSSATSVQEGLIANIDNTAIRTMAGDETWTDLYKQVQSLDPGGAARTVTLPAEAISEGIYFEVSNNADAIESLTIQDDTTVPVTIHTLARQKRAVLYCDGTTWHVVYSHTID